MSFTFRVVDSFVAGVIRSLTMERKKLISLYLGVFLTSLSAIVFEISLTKIFSVTLWYHFAYFAVSLALFGLGAGGLVIFFRRAYFSQRFPGILKHLAALQCVSIIICLIFVLAIPQNPFPNLTYILSLVGTYIICAIPFIFTGAILALSFHHCVENTPKIYFSDLLGAAAGCFIFLGAISIVSGPSVVLLAAFIALAASFFFCDPYNRRAIVLRATLMVLAVIALSFLKVNTHLFSIKHTKTFEERNDLLFEKWSPLARITVYPSVWWRDDPDAPFGWGMSKKFKSDKPIEQLWIQQDACAGSPITRFNGDISELDYLKYDITSIVYLVRPDISSVFIIGPGGGRDVLSALYFGVPSITACDINPIIVNLVKDKFKDFAGNLYDQPGVAVAIGEARSYIKHQDQKFDVILIPLIDSWAATAAGAFALAENNLYTVEAFSDYLDRLTEDGCLSITRFLFKPRNQSLRVAILGRASLETQGVKTPGKNIAVISSGEKEALATVLIKKTAFSQKEIEGIREAALELDFDILYLPGPDHEGDPDFVRALSIEPLEAFTDQYYYDVRPSTDDRPFFFQMIYFSRAFDVIFREDIVGQTFNYYAPLVVIVLLVLSSALVLVFYILPLLRAKLVERVPKLWGIYFILLGVGFMFVEIPMLQKGALYLGHPTFSLSIVLFSMLTFAGCGSYWSGQISESRLQNLLRKYLILIILLIGIVALGSEWLIKHTIVYPLGIRMALFVLLIGLVAFFMGMAFPSGIRLVSQDQKNSIPWVWALNGGASVLGSVIAMALAMTIGYTLTLILGSVCYFIAFLTIFKQRPSAA
jgi:predicted membrane-bound spermidine synthase